MKAAFDAFTAGAKSVNPKSDVLVSYIGNWEDASAGKEQALAQLARGADVIFQDADAAGTRGVPGCARIQGRVHHRLERGSERRRPEVTLGSVVIDVPHAFMVVAREVRSGHSNPVSCKLDMRRDVVRWTVNPALAARIPVAAMHAVDSVRAAMLAGRFTLPSASIPR